MLYTRLASPVAMCIDIPRRYTQLAYPNPNLLTLTLTLTHTLTLLTLATASRVPIRVYTASRVYRHFL